MRIIFEINSEKVFNTFKFGISAEELENKDNYQLMFLSVFDHWLSEEESENAFTIDKQVEYKKKLYLFYQYLYKNYYLCTYFVSDVGSRCLLEFESKEEYLNYVDLSLQEYYFLRLLIPDYGIIIDGGYDYTLPVFCSKNDNVVNLNFLKKTGLFILE